MINEASSVAKKIASCFLDMIPGLCFVFTHYPTDKHMLLGKRIISSFFKNRFILFNREKREIEKRKD